MTTQSDKAKAFAALHQPGNPVVIYNIWDAGGAQALESAGAKAVATGSASVAGAQGYADGQAIPLDLLLTLVERITAGVALPVSVDFEGGYATDPANLTKNIARLIAAGAIGLNFEDQIVGGNGLYSTADQAKRIAAVRQAGDGAGVPIFINARTDLFLKAPAEGHAALIGDALARGQAYAAAGASGFFVPGLVDPALIAAVVASSTLPVNVMMSPSAPPPKVLAGLGVARLSHGPFPWRAQMAALADGWRAATAHQAKA
jgi:2-methylisocitrate lyase-like PEP mutase family enzyme